MSAFTTTSNRTGLLPPAPLHAHPPLPPHTSSADTSLDDLVLLGILTQTFIVGGLVVIFSTGGTEYDPVRDLTHIGCVLLTVAVYGMGEYAHPSFSFDEWGYLFVITLVGLGHLAIVMRTNQLEPTTANLIAMSLAFAMLVCVSMRVNGGGAPHCSGPVTLAVLICMLPLRNSLVLLKSSISSFDARMKAARIRLICFVGVWMMRLCCIGLASFCAGLLSLRTYAFMCVSIDLFMAALACDVMW